MSETKETYDEVHESALAILALGATAALAAPSVTSVETAKGKVCSLPLWSANQISQPSRGTKRERPAKHTVADVQVESANSARGADNWLR